MCVDGCPVQHPDPRIHPCGRRRATWPGAAKILRGANPLPSICGRVCPQESQCEAECQHGQALQPGGDRPPRALRRRLGAHAADQGATSKITRKEKIAVIGAGPSGLVCAGELARLGYPVTIYEALHAPGGVLRYGIPEFRLPKAILDWEIGVLKAMGVEIVCNVVIGRTLRWTTCSSSMGYAAVFIGTGAGLPQFLGIPGENLNGVMSANEFLTRMNLMRGYEFPETDTPREGRQARRRDRRGQHRDGRGALVAAHGRRGGLRSSTAAARRRWARGSRNTTTRSRKA